jgi:Possible hemagglutinin (DUF637)
VVAYFTAGVASEAGAAVGAAVDGTAAGGAAVAVGTTGAVAEVSLTATIAAGATTAAVSTLASQAAVALINNKGDVGGALHDLGSSDNVKGLVASIVTGGVLGGLNLNATGGPTQSAGASPFINQLGQNLQAGAAKAVVNTAIYGTSLGDNLKTEIKGALISTVAAQTAFAIGDQHLDEFTNKVAHAIAGCVAGAASTVGTSAGKGSGCSAGALGAAVGEISAELYGAKADTVRFASMVAGIAAAVTGQDINLASAAGGNAAANNFLNHTQAASLKKDIAACQAKPGGCTDDQVVGIFNKYRDLSTQNIATVQDCITKGDVACVTKLESQSANASEVSGVLPVGYGSLETVLIGRQNNVNNYGSVKGQQSLFGSDAQQAQDVAKFRSDNCASLSAGACNTLVQQALDDRLARVGVLMLAGALTPVAVNGLRTLIVPKLNGNGAYAAKPPLVIGDEDLANVYANQKQSTYTNGLPVQRIIYNGVELNPSLPPPEAGYGYSPSLVKNATTESQAYSHLTGFQGEINLANEVAAQGQTVVKWGGPVGTNGSDVISVNPNTGEVLLWDGKFRSSPTTIEQSPTFANKGPLANAVQEARDAIDRSSLPQSVKDAATQNLKDGNFTTNTVGAGSVRNSVHVRYCDGNPC